MDWQLHGILHETYGVNEAVVNQKAEWKETLLIVLSCFHVYCEIWMPNSKAGNTHDCYAVSVAKDGAVGHSPTKMSCLFSLFIG